MDSILNSVKAMIGLAPDYAPFDNEVIIHINSVLMILNQLGVGTEPFSVTGPDETWDQLVPNINYLQLVKSYVYLKVLLLWDHTLGTGTVEAIERQIKEDEWRITVKVDEINKVNQNV